MALQAQMPKRVWQEVVQPEPMQVVRVQTQAQQAQVQGWEPKLHRLVFVLLPSPPYLLRVRRQMDSQAVQQPDSY